MAKTLKGQTAVVTKVKPNINRPGVHAKKKTSALKSSKNYVKAYRGQGR